MQPVCDGRCPWCGQPLTLVWVHGHGQCARCGVNSEECCRGETAEATRAPVQRPQLLGRAPERG